MIAYHAPRSLLRRLGERDRLVVPRRVDEALFAVLLDAERRRHEVPHAVDEAHPKRPARGERQLRSLVRDELRLGGHHRSPARRLRERVAHFGGLRLAFDKREHRALGEALDERALARAHRADHADDELAARARRYVVVNTSVCPARTARFNDPVSHLYEYPPFRL